MMTHQQEQIKTFTNERKVNASDELCDAEIAACKAKREKANGSHDEPPRYCWCAELLLDGKRLPVPKFHNCDYVAARSACVFSAAALATSTGAPGNDFTRTFAREMERLSRPLLRS
jgi:hypothetical protein